MSELITKHADTGYAMLRVVRRMYSLALSRESTGQPIIGAEFWAQVRHVSEHINPHFDKDEHLFFRNPGHPVLRTPVLSTVTYLDSLGGPTAIFNQSVSPQMLLEPATPNGVFLVYPKRARHVIFRGDMYHAVRGDLARPPPTSNPGYRVTFLINWWTAPALLQSADNRGVLFSDEWAQQHGLQPAVKMPQGSTAPVARPMSPLVHDVDQFTSGDGTQLLSMGLFAPKGQHGERTFHFSVPSFVGADAHWVRWPSERAAYLGSPTLSKDNPFTTAIFFSATPKLVVSPICCDVRLAVVYHSEKMTSEW